MQTAEEQKKQPDAYKFFELASDGDIAVKNAMTSFWNFAHVFDDLIDEVKWPKEKKEMAFKALHDFVVDLLVNPFVRSNALGLQALFVSALTRCLDGDEIAKSAVDAERALAPAVRCGDIDVIMHMAYLHRGWDVMRGFSQMRKYDIGE